MRVGVISDTHDRLPMIEAAMRLFADRGVDALVHPGDFVAPFSVKPLLAATVPLYATFGNNDGERRGLKKLLPQVQDGPLFIDLGGRSVLVHHFIDWCSADDIDRAEIVITGHTHSAELRRESGKLFLNPGECCGWVTGRCSVAVLDTTDLSVDIVDLLKR